MNNLTTSIMDIMIASRAQCCCEDMGNKSCSHATMLLHLLHNADQTCTNIKSKLIINKSNLAILCRKLISSGLIISRKAHNSKNIIYSITPLGKQYYSSRMAIIQSKYNNPDERASQILAAALTIIER